MKILNFKIKGYKNTSKKEAFFDFEKCIQYVALIGLNGSGKSNILEAISIIFSNLYQGSKTNFDYEILYELNGDIVRVKQDLMTVKGKKITKANHFHYLPANVITSYSGEELRMWEEIYFPSYSLFFRDIKESTDSAPNMLYINKYVWEFALIALLSSEKEPVKKFIQEILRIDPAKVSISFRFNDDNVDSYPENKAIVFVKQLIDAQKKSKGKLEVNQISSINPDALANDDLVKRLFYNLFIVGMPVKNEKTKIYTEKVIQETKIEFNDIDVKKLSEGEKKLILLNCIIHLLADSESLVLLDEPDAHIHIDRKKEIIEIINQPEHFTIFTTHSPKILHCINDNNVRIIRNTEENGVEVIHLDKMHALTEITNGEFSIIDATLALSSDKDILLVEGEYDYQYITEAIKRLNIIKADKYKDFNFTIINCGGAGNVSAIFKEIIAPNLKTTQVCIATFDLDKAGKDGIASLKKVLDDKPMSNVDYMTHTALPTWDKTKEFFMEDYFPLTIYKKLLLEDIEKKNKIKDFQQLSKDSVKTLINSNYKDEKIFKNNDFENFELLLDEIIRRRNVLKTNKEVPVVKKTTNQAKKVVEKLSKE